MSEVENASVWVLGQKVQSVRSCSEKHTHPKDSLQRCT